MNKVIYEINQFYRILATECPKYKNIVVTKDDLNNELILSEILYDIADNEYVYEGAEELYRDVVHYADKQVSRYNATPITIAIITFVSILLIFALAIACDSKAISFEQILLQTIIVLGISTSVLITIFKIIGKRGK